jgi:hypothetical protein
MGLMPEEIIKIARLKPGEPHSEIENLAITIDPTIEGFFLRLHSRLDEPSLAEYWFQSLDLIDRQARTLFGGRFHGWDNPK